MLHHIELWVPSLPGSSGPWGWLLGELGWTVFQDWPGGRSWRHGGVYLVLEQSTALSGSVHDRLAPGLNHVRREPLHGAWWAAEQTTAEGPCQQLAAATRPTWVSRQRPANRESSPPDAWRTVGQAAAARPCATLRRPMTSGRRRPRGQREPANDGPPTAGSRPEAGASPGRHSAARASGRAA